MFGRLIALLAVGEAAGLKRRLKAAVIAYVLIAVAALLALLFLLLAAYLAAATRWGAVWAALWFGVGFVVLCALILLIHKTAAAAEQRAQRRKRADAGLVAGASVLAMLPSVLGRKAGAAGLLLALTGVVGFAAYKELRRAGRESRAPRE